MEQAFTLPFPKTVRTPEIEEQGEDSKAHFWRASLTRLEEKKESWEQFLQGHPLLEHPALRFVTNREGNTLLHLAILSNRLDLVQLLGKDLQFKFKRNTQGLTPLELAQFLGRKGMVEFLSSRPSLSFFQQPNVSFPDGLDLLPEDLEFLRSPAFESEEIFHDISSRTQKAKSHDAIDPERIWMGIYFDQEIQEGLHPPVSVRYVDRQVGFGVFPEQRIPPCAYVGEYTGVVRERKKEENHYSIRYTVWEMEKRKFLLDGERKGNFTRFINHSAKPNLCLQSVYWRGIPRMIFVTLKEIPERSQLTFDYGPLFWKQCKKTPKLLK